MSIIESYQKSITRKRETITKLLNDRSTRGWIVEKHTIGEWVLHNKRRGNMHREGYRTEAYIRSMQ